MLIAEAYAGDLPLSDEPHNTAPFVNGVDDFSAHEIALNLPYALGGVLDVTYQYWINPNLGIRLRGLKGYGLIGSADSRYLKNYAYGVVLSKSIFKTKAIYLFAERLHSEVEYTFEDAVRQSEEYRDDGESMGLGYGWGSDEIRWSIEYATNNFDTINTTLSSGGSNEIFARKYLAIKARYIW